MNVDRAVVSFFALFLTVYFLESIGGFFMTSAIVAIEKQFQIPSKVSGTMVSASDFGYIPSVIFVAYLGGKGNRARWIGAGCMLIAVANLIIASSNFLFPTKSVALNNSAFEASIVRNLDRLPSGVGGILRQLPPAVRDDFGRSGSYEFFDQCDRLRDLNQSSVSCNVVQQILERENPATLVDVENLRVMSAMSYAFCDRQLNRLRGMIEAIRCLRPHSSGGPTATIFSGLLLLGIGRTMPFSLGLPLVDDNVRKANLPLYFAGLFAIRLFGPVLGLMLGAFFNSHNLQVFEVFCRYYYTFDPPHGLSPRDPLWIGAWWAGFLLLGFVLFGPSLALFCFKEPPESDEDADAEVADAKEAALVGDTPAAGKAPDKKPRRGLALRDRNLEKRTDGRSMPKTFKGKARDFAMTIKSILRRRVYVAMLAGRIIDVIAFKGFFIFLPKYLEVQFGVPQYKVNMYMGMIGIAGFAIGVTSGSVLMRVLKLEGRKAATWIAVCSLLAACSSFLNAGVGCESTVSALGKL